MQDLIIKKIELTQPNKKFNFLLILIVLKINKLINFNLMNRKYQRILLLGIKIEDFMTELFSQQQFQQIFLI